MRLRILSKINKSLIIYKKFLNDLKKFLQFFFYLFPYLIYVNDLNKYVP